MRSSELTMGERADRRIAGYWADLPPAAGGVVMATGIVSVDLHVYGYEVLSRILLILAAAVWIVLAHDFGHRLLRNPGRWLAEANTPPSLTAIAGTCVVGTRVTILGWQALAAVLLVLAAITWSVLMPDVTRRWQRDMPGAVFLVCVATEAIAVLSAALADGGARHWLDWVAAAFFILGLVLYAAALVRFDFRQVAEGAGDQWIAGGGLAISALACSKFAASHTWAGITHHVLRGVTLTLLALAAAWYVVLLLAEVRWYRPRYDIRRWATVFPMGMTAAASLSTSAVLHIAWLKTAGNVLLWIAVAAWLAAAAGLIRSSLTPRR